MVDHNSPIKIAAFTGTRAEYGLLRHLLKEINADLSFELQLIVSGSHLSSSLGLTVNEIESDGLKPTHFVPLGLERTPRPSMAELTSIALSGIAACLLSSQPELIIILGDRYEAFACAAASHLTGIPIVHLHGGETTEGALDDNLRHAITQLSTWHFTAADLYTKRVISMGKSATNVFTVGPLVLDGILRATELSRSDFERLTGYRFGDTNLLVTYHPETLREDRGIEGFQALLNILERLDTHVLFTYPNVDDGSEDLLNLLHHFVERHSDRAWCIPSLGHERYLAALHLFEAMGGNSSSGIIEAPIVGMPVLNIGDRQQGRLRFGPNVFDALPETDSVSSALQQALLAGQRLVWPRKCAAPTLTPTSAIMEWLRNQQWR